MRRILFWNINRKDLRVLLCEATKACSADVVVLIEASENSADTLATLKSNVSPDFYQPSSTAGRFQLFCRDAGLSLTEFYGGDRVSLRRLLYKRTEFILGLVHVVDRHNWDPMNQSTQVTLLAQELQQYEQKRGHSRTLLIGDFNMNPFDQAMTMAAGMNAMMTKKCVTRGSRTSQSRKYTYFYNPMWGLFGDNTPGPSGTYLSLQLVERRYGWNMLDQVLVRPDAIPWFKGVTILRNAGDTRLHRNSGRPEQDSGVRPLSTSPHFEVSRP